MPDQDPAFGSTGTSDKRYFPRWEIDHKVLYRLDGDAQLSQGATKDISCAGACIVGNRYVAPRQKITMTIQLTEVTWVNLNAHILWAKSKGGQLQMGVTFHDTPDEIQDLILQHAFELDKKRMLDQWYKGWSNS